MWEALRPDPDWEWCPIHDAWHDPGDCPDCDAEDALCHGGPDWGPDDTVGLTDSGWYPTPSDQWYLDLVTRAEFPGTDPHHDWRD